MNALLISMRKHIFMTTLFAFVLILSASAFAPYSRVLSRSKPTRSRSDILSLPTSTSLFSTSTLPRLPSSAIEELSTKGYLILDDFIPSDLVQELRDDIDNLREKDKFNIAKIGQDSTNTLNTDIRIAETCFIGESKLQDVPSSSRNKLYQVLESLRSDLSGNEKLDVKDSFGELIKAAPALLA